MLNISESINYRDYMRSLKVHPLALSDIKIIQKQFGIKTISMWKTI